MKAAVEYKPSVTQYDILDYTYLNLHKNGWQTTFNYLQHKPKQFFNSSLSIDKANTAEFIKYVDYCYLLSNTLTAGDEGARYVERQGTCIYFSVVLYWLLVHFGAATDKRLKFCQGYFRYTRDDLSTGSRNRAGMHAWLSLCGAVIDVTIWQQKQYFDFEKRGITFPVIIGDIPEGINYFGFEEEKSLAKEYARQFAKDSGMTFYDWINYHKLQADAIGELRFRQVQEQEKSKIMYEGSEMGDAMAKFDSNLDVAATG